MRCSFPQALLSQSFRLLALQLLHAFLCLGPWAVDQANSCDLG